MHLPRLAEVCRLPTGRSEWECTAAKHRPVGIYSDAGKTSSRNGHRCGLFDQLFSADCWNERPAPYTAYPGKIQAPSPVPWAKTTQVLSGHMVLARGSCAPPPPRIVLRADLSQFLSTTTRWPFPLEYVFGAGRQSRGWYAATMGPPIRQPPGRQALRPEEYPYE